MKTKATFFLLLSGLVMLLISAGLPGPDRNRAQTFASPAPRKDICM
jgi:hypothetical protein